MFCVLCDVYTLTQTYTHTLTASLELDKVPLYRPSRFQTCGSFLLAVQLGLCVGHHIPQSTDLQAVGTQRTTCIYPTPWKSMETLRSWLYRREQYKPSIATLLWLWCTSPCAASRWLIEVQKTHDWDILALLGKMAYWFVTCIILGSAL